MRTGVAALTCGLALTALDAGVAAQNAEQVRQLVEVQVLDVHPSDVSAFEEAVAHLGAVAGSAGLPETFGWRTWTDVFEYRVASFHDAFAAFDDPGAWMRQFEGTGAETEVARAMEAFSSLSIRTLRREVLEAEPDWAYEPEGAAPVGGAEILEVWVSPGKSEAFDSAVSRMIAFYESMGRSYGTQGYRTHFGDTGRVVLATYYDELAAFVGSGTVEAQARAADRLEEWEAIVAEFLTVTDRVRRRFLTYRADLSYPISEAGASASGLP